MEKCNALTNPHCAIAPVKYIQSEPPDSLCHGISHESRVGITLHVAGEHDRAETTLSGGAHSVRVIPFDLLNVDDLLAEVGLDIGQSKRRREPGTRLRNPAIRFGDDEERLPAE